MYELNREKFGTFVAALRREKGMTQKELAWQLHVTDKAVSKWETGVAIPDASILLPLSEVLGVTVTELLLGERTEAKLPPEQIEALVKAAIGYPSGKTRSYQAKSRWPLFFAAAAVVSALELWGCYMLEIPSALLPTLPLLCLIFGAYFCLFAPLQLPGYHDHGRIGAVSDGPFRMNLPGVAINNRNWPKLLLVGRCWACAAAVLLPPAIMALWRVLPVIFSQVELALGLLVTLGGLFVPMCVVGKRYE